MAQRRRSRSSRGGFGFWGPLPSYSRRTQRGSFRVSGCCLPLALTMSTIPALGARVAYRAVRTR